MMIAVTGGKGSGKSTVSALLVRELLRAGHRPLLAIDASPRPGLHGALGVRRPRTVESMHGELLASGSGGAPAEKMVEALLNQRVEEGEGVDLVAIGRELEQAGDLHLSSLLRRSLARLSTHYRAVVSDEGAGVEGLARRNLAVIDHLVLVVDPSPRGIDGAFDFAVSAGRSPLRVQKRWLLLNHVHGGTFDSTAGPAITVPEGFLLLGVVPHDPLPGARGGEGGAFLDPSWSSPATAAVETAVCQGLLDRSGLDTRRILDV